MLIVNKVYAGIISEIRQSHKGFYLGAFILNLLSQTFKFELKLKLVQIGISILVDQHK